jgi:hypothetical protein
MSKQDSQKQSPKSRRFIIDVRLGVVLIWDTWKHVTEDDKLNGRGAFHSEVFPSITVFDKAFHRVGKEFVGCDDICREMQKLTRRLNRNHPIIRKPDTSSGHRKSC